jgi:hypothetical protein
MPDIETTALIERLQQSNRRWKRLALSLLAALGLTILLLTTSAIVLSVRLEQQRRQLQAAETEARMQAEDALRREREARYRLDVAMQAVELQHQGQHP